MHVGLRQREALAGIMVLSAYLPLDAAAATEATPAGRATPILMCHGRQDPVVVFQRGELSRDLLRSFGMLVDWHAYTMGHSICPAEIAEIARWLGSRTG